MYIYNGNFDITRPPASPTIGENIQGLLEFQPDIFSMLYFCNEGYEAESIHLLLQGQICCSILHVESLNQLTRIY